MKQLTLFEYLDEQQGYSMCGSCENAKYKFRTKNGHDVWYCNIKHSMITEHTGSWLCKNEYFVRRAEDRAAGTINRL